MSIEARLPDFVQQLLQTGTDVGRLSSLLRKPLRPLWITQATRIWTNMVPNPGELVFFPLVLLSASAPVPASAHGQSFWQSIRPSAIPGSVEMEEGEDARTQTFYYLPGAADDEETWAEGLTPDLLWKHQRRLLASDPSSVQAMVCALIAEKRTSEGCQGSAVPAPTTHSAHDSTSTPLQVADDARLNPLARVRPRPALRQDPQNGGRSQPATGVAPDSDPLPAGWLELDEAPAAAVCR